MEGGSKTIDRVGAIMRALENGPEDGMTTAEIAASAGFDRATTHRALVSLERIGFVDRDPRSRNIRLGVYMFSLGAKTARRFSPLVHARDAVARLAEKTGDTAYLVVKNKYDCVCIDRCSGSYPIKAQTLSIGESVPLGVSTAGLAILAMMPDIQVRHAIEYNTMSMHQLRRVSREDLARHVKVTRQRGYALYQGQIIAGMGAIGFALRDSSGQPVAALSIAMVLDRLSKDRIEKLALLIREEVEQIEQRARSMSQFEFGGA